MEPLVAWVELAVVLVESSSSDSALSPFFLYSFRGFTEAGQVSKELQLNSFSIAAWRKEMWGLFDLHAT